MPVGEFSRWMLGRASGLPDTGMNTKLARPGRSASSCCKNVCAYFETASSSLVYRLGRVRLPCPRFSVCRGVQRASVYPRVIRGPA